MRRSLTALFLSMGWLLVPGVVVAQENPYRYVKMSLAVPWTLYFMFLVCVLIPFVILVILAWRSQSGGRSNENAARTDQTKIADQAARGLK